MGRISKEIKTQLALGVYSQYIFAAYSRNWVLEKLLSEQHNKLTRQIKLFIPHSCKLRKNMLKYGVASCKDAWTLMCSPQQLDLLIADLNILGEGIAIHVFELDKPDGNWILRNSI